MVMGGLATALDVRASTALLVAASYSPVWRQTALPRPNYAKSKGRSITFRPTKPFLPWRSNAPL